MPEHGVIKELCPILVIMDIAQKAHQGGNSKHFIYN
jgi:hypothetical protein